MRKIVISLLVFILFSCSSKEREEDNLGATTNNCIDIISDNGYSNRYCEKIYPTGELMETYTSLGDSILDGIYKTFYKNGQLKDSSFYAGGAIFDWYESFYKDGNKKRTVHYVILGAGKYSYRNQFAEFDSLTGEIKRDKSFFYSFELKPKTIKDGDSLTVNFYFNCPMYKDTAYLEIGNYDEFFRISKEDKEKTKIIPVVNQKAKFKIEAVKKDYNSVRGIIYNFSLNDTTKLRNFYFNRRYYVE